VFHWTCVVYLFEIFFDISFRIFIHSVSLLFCSFVYTTYFRYEILKAFRIIIALFWDVVSHTHGETDVNVAEEMLLAYLGKNNLFYRGVGGSIFLYILIHTA
jgi:hypothetical protein